MTQVHKKNLTSGWWRGRNMTTGEVGWLPSSFVSEKVPDDDHDSIMHVEYEEVEVDDSDTSDSFQM